MPPSKKPAPSPSTPKPNGSILNFFGRGASSTSLNGATPGRKGKRKADIGSAADPVVISDEEVEELPRKQARRADPGPSDSGSSTNGAPSRASSDPHNETEEEAADGEAEAALAAECMMCGKPLPSDSASAEAHVNACLDADSQPPKPSSDPPVKSKPVNQKDKGKAKDPSPEVVVLSPDPSQPPKKVVRPEQGPRAERDSTPRPITSISHSLRTDPAPSTTNGKANAFSVLMSSHKDKENWAEVDAPKPVTGRRRPAPFYKILTGMPIAVDGFCYGEIPGVTAYFLTHAHSDHYTNLSKSWRHGPIYCSETTANLVVLMLGVEPQWVHGIPDNVPWTIPNTGGVKVTLIEANHCPGSSVFLFEGPQTAHAGDSSFRSAYVGSKRVFRYLHCGDFRACPKHVLHPEVARAPVDTVYLDTTYLNPQYCFPPQPLVIQACAELARKIAFDDVDIKPKIEAAEAVGDEEEEAEMPGDLEYLPEEEEEEEEVKPEVAGEADEDIKPNVDGGYPDGQCPEEAEELALAERDGKVKPTVTNGSEPYSIRDGDETPDIKPDIKPHIKPDVTPDIKPDNNSDVKPDIKPDIKPDVKPHPAAAAYDFLERSVNMMEGWLNKHPSKSAQEPKAKGRVLVLVGTYTIGKERIVKAIARALDSKIYCDERKRGIIRAQADPELHDMISDDPRACQVHIVPLWNVQLERLQPYLEALEPAFERVLAFRPTGWTYRSPAGTNTLPDVNFVIQRDQARGFSDVSLRTIRGSSRQFMMFGIPYSEHSSFFELTCFSLSVPGTPKIIATVNVGSERSRMKMKKWFEKWLSEKNRRGERGQPAIVHYRDEDFW